MQNEQNEQNVPRVQRACANIQAIWAANAAKVQPQQTRKKNTAVAATNGSLKLTELDIKILTYLREYPGSKARGIATGLGIDNTKTVSRAIGSLRKRNAIRPDGQKRGMVYYATQVGQDAISRL